MEALGDATHHKGPYLNTWQTNSRWPRMRQPRARTAQSLTRIPRASRGAPKSSLPGTPDG